MKEITTLAGASLFALALTLTPFSIKEAAAQQDGGDAIEEVVVTGSRIRQDPLDEGSPVLQISKQDIDRSGLTSIGDYLQRLSSSGGALNTRFNSSGNSRTITEIWILPAGSVPIH